MAWFTFAPLLVEPLMQAPMVGVEPEEQSPGRLIAATAEAQASSANAHTNRRAMVIGGLSI